MMKYICLQCESTFDEPDICVERHGFTDGMYEKYSVCPHCGGDYTEAAPCVCCGRETFEEELIEGVCEDCLSEHKYDVETCYYIGNLDKVYIEINSFYAFLYSASEIEELIRRDLEKTLEVKKIDCSAFIGKNKMQFAERLAEEVKENENTKN